MKNRYVKFKDIPVGSKFGWNDRWLKQSTRTGRSLMVDKVFYFRQKDIVMYSGEIKNEV